MSKRICLLLLMLALVAPTGSRAADEEIVCWFPPAWQDRVGQAEQIASALSRGAAIPIRARIAESYPEILDAFASNRQNLVYVGSFVQSILAARNLGIPLVQSIDGVEMYAGILLVRSGEDPAHVLSNDPKRIAYTIGTSSGESSARAATGGQASIGTKSHAEAAAAVLQGWAAGAFVKDWWWVVNREHYPGLEMHMVPGVSIQMNPDNVLTASRTVPEALRSRIRTAAKASPKAFGDQAFIQDFSPGKLAFPLGLMRKGGIDPLTYRW